MNMHFTKLALAVGLCAGSLGPVAAGPIQWSQIPADAAWFVNLDVDKLKTTQAGQYLMDELGKPDAQQKLAVFTGVFNFDPTKKLKGLTLYSRGKTPADAVLLLHGDFDPERLATLAKMGKDYESSQHGNYTIHGWVDERKKETAGEGARSFGAVYNSSLVVLGQKAERIGDALDMLAGAEGKGLSSKSLPQGALRTESVVVLGQARRSGLGQLPPNAAFSPNAAFLKNFKTISLAAGEAQDNLALDLVIETESEDAARNLLAIGQGLLAWQAFQGDKNGGNKLLQGLSTTQKDSCVTLSLRVPTTDAIQMMKDAQAKKAERRR